MFDSKKRKEVNLLPTSDFEKSLIGKTLLWALKAGRYIIIVTEFIVIIAFLSRFKLDRDLADLNESIQERQATVKSFSEIEDQVRFLQKKIKIIKELKTEQIQTLEALTNLSQITPSDIYLTSLSLTPETLDIEAVSLSDASLAIFLSALQKNEIFNQPNLTSLTKGGSKKPEIKFSLKAEIVK